jgi:hypothetical protein
MRIPVYKTDITDKSFSRLARHIKSKFPTRISLSESQNILSKCLGYNDFHEVTNFTNAIKHATTLKVVAVTEINEQCFGYLVEFLKLSKEDALHALSDCPFQMLKCTQENSAKFNLLDLVVGHYSRELKNLYFTSLQRPLIVGSPTKFPGFFSIRELLKQHKIEDLCFDPNESILSLITRSKNIAIIEDLASLEHRFIDHVIKFPGESLLGFYETLSGKYGITTSEIENQCRELAFNIRLELAKKMDVFRRSNVSELYFKPRYSNGFYWSYPLRAHDTKGMKKTSDGLFHFRVGSDEYSYDSLPWTIHGLSSAWFDEHGFRTADLEGSIYKCKGTYRIDGDDLVYAADHKDDADVPMAREAMEQIINKHGRNNDYSHIFDDSVVFFLQSWERRGDVAHGLGKKLLTKTLRSLYTKYKMPILLVCDAKSPKITEWKGGPEFVLKAKSSIQERIVSSVLECVEAMDPDGEKILDVIFVNNEDDIYDTQAQLHDFYTRIHRQMN